ncbi:hypothetical protein OIU84_011886 [Salix udensis]|uniref:Pentatricopeptide repeat-containing protein n=1 Tax=Salix udensis TaxID=889485 RepID=A0AAD6NXH1_9ROSI|nr:hypothetical protein OIU84_011886 [Salix udensis]
MDLIRQLCKNNAGAREICHTLLKRCANLNKLNEGKIIHALLLNSRFSDDLVMQNTLLNMYAKCGDLVNARKLFDEMSIRDVVTWTALITGYSQHDGPQAALLLLPEMLRIGLKPNQFTLASLLKAASGVGSTDVLQGCDHLEEAQLIFDVMVSKNEVSWNSLIAGYARKGQGDKGFLFVLEHAEGEC